MSEAKYKLMLPENEPILNFAPGSDEKAEIKTVLKDLASSEIEIPIIIGGKEIRTGRTAQCVMPHNHKHVLATYHQAGPEEVELAAKAAKMAWHEWSRLPWHERISIFLKAAELLAGP